MSQASLKPTFKYTSIIEMSLCAVIVGTLFAALLPAMISAKSFPKKRAFHLVPAEYHYINPFVETWWYSLICGLSLSLVLFLILLSIRRLLPPRLRYLYPLRNRDAIPGGWKALVVGLINLGIFLSLGMAFIFWFGHVHRPTPFWIPTDPPSEANRTTHPRGYSIIIDPQWRIDFNSIRSMNSLDEKSNVFFRDSLVAYPVHDLGTAVHPWPFLSVTRYSNRPQIADTMRPTEFQGKPTFEHFLPIARKPPLQCGYELIFQRDDSWFHIAWFKYVSEQESKTLTTLPPMIRTYIETFRDTRK